MRRLAQDFQAGRVLRRHIRAVLVAKREPQGHYIWPRRLTGDTTPDVVFPARRRVLVEDQLRRRRRPRALIRRLRRAKVVLADDELRRRRNGGRVVALSVGAEDAVEISDRPGSPWTGVGGRCKTNSVIPRAPIYNRCP